MGQGAHGPPQSTPDSRPFRSPSSQRAALLAIAKRGKLMLPCPGGHAPSGAAGALALRTSPHGTPPLSLWTTTTEFESIR